MAGVMAMQDGALLVRDLMSKNIIALEPEATVADALARMEQHGLSELPVMSNSTLRGWVSYDLLVQRAAINHAAKIAHVMETPPHLPKTADAVTAADFLIRNTARALPVVDDKGKVVGILSRTDLLEAVARLPALADLPLDQVMNRELETVRESSGVDHAAARLRQLHFNQLLVLDDGGRLQGYVSKEDVFKTTYREHNSVSPAGGRGHARRQAGRSGAPHVDVRGLVRTAPTLPPTATVAKAIGLMRQQRTTFVAIVEDGFAVGILSRANVLERLAHVRPLEGAVAVQITGLHGVADPGDVSEIRSLAEATLHKVKQQLDVEFLNLHFKVYKAKEGEETGDQKFSLSAHLSGGGQFFVQKGDDWTLLGVVKQVLEKLAERVWDLKDRRLEKRKGPPRRGASFYTASPS